MFKVNDWIILVNEERFITMHSNNVDIIKKIRGLPLRIKRISSDGDVQSYVGKNGKEFDFGIFYTELVQCFEIYNENKNKHGNFKIILTYIEEGKTITEEGVNYIDVTSETVEYKYNRKKLGFLKYQGEVKLEITELKQITVSTPECERVFHIENGKIVREHIMYDNTRTFKAFKIGE